MLKRGCLRFSFVLIVAALSFGISQGSAQNKDKMPTMTPEQMMAQKIKPAQRQAAAERLQAAKAAAEAASQQAAAGKGYKAIVNQPKSEALVSDPVTGALVPDYFGTTPNWAWSPQLTKFMDTLPDLKGLIAHPDTVSYPGSDYYEISLFEGNWTFHSSLSPTKIRMYRQTNNGTATNSSCSPQPLCQNTVPPPPANYLGPVIVATKGRPVRIKFTNNLPAGAGGNLFIPTDTTVMGAGTGPDGTNYPQNRGTLHLHGGFTPWVSDGTPHQWVTPAAETASLKTGVSTQGVPDMDLPSGDSMMFYWPNQQSGRLMFYHDHAYGITRLNVYSGEAAGYLLFDPAEEGALAAAGVPGTPSDLGHLIPLVIQDRTFVSTASTGSPATCTSDPTWCDPIRPQWGRTDGSLWFPHVYMPNQNPWDMSGANAMGRWDYALWFWPPFNGLLTHGTVPNPYYNPTTAPWEPPEIPGTPNPSIVPEAFMDTPVVNGKAYPTLTVSAQKYQFRILNAANDRFWNLSLWVAADKTGPTTAGSDPTGTLTRLCNGTVSASNCTEVKMVPFNSTQNVATPFPAWWYDQGQPFTFDDRVGGVPDPTTRGPAMIQIGTEGGILPAPAVILNQPVNFTYNRKNVVVLNVQQKALFLGPAERADVIIDFTQFAGKTLILYNDAPTPVPAADSRLDYYTGDPDQTATGGAPATLPGMGPNTRTIMQIVVTGTPGTSTPDAIDTALCGTQAQPATCSGGSLALTTTGLPAAFRTYQDPILVPQKAYDPAYGTTTTDVPGANFSRISDTSLTFTPLAQNCPGTYPCGLGAPLPMGLQPKAIQELFENDYGRMNAILGVEIPFTNGGNQTTIPYGYIDPTTEALSTSRAIAPPSLGDGTQIWKITHNGVDTHAIHFHLLNVQVINRVGWDGAIRPPDPNELGWKETVRMNPLEDIIVAMRPTTPQLPFGLPDSIRALDVTSPLGTTGQFANVDPLGRPVTVVNALSNFGWEYVWHCHLLGHEENDMMRPLEFQPTVNLPATTTLLAQAGSPDPAVLLSWVDTTAFNYSSPGPNQAAWGNTANEVGFTIQRSTASNFGQGLITFQARANRTSFTDTTTQSNTQYFYRVAAFNAAGTAPWSATATITTAAGPVPAEPTGLTATVISATQVRLNWVDNSTNETGFVVERSPDGTTWPTLPLATLAKNVVTYTDGSVTVGQTYYYRVKAVNGTASSLYSNTVTLTTSIAAPSNLTGAVTSSVAGGNTSVTLKWTDNAVNEANYKVERSPDGATWMLLTPSPTFLPANTITYTDTFPTPGTPLTYQYRVTAINGAVSSPSAQISVGVSVPAAPSNLRGTSVALGGNKRAVVLGWLDNSNNETSFTIQRCTGTPLTTCGVAAPGWANVTTTVAANATTYQDNGVVKAQTYSYQIRAVNGIGPSAWSNVFVVSTP